MTEDKIIEWYNEDFEPEIEGMTDMGEPMRLSVIRIVGGNNDPIHCVYCGGVCKREIWAGPPSGIKGDYGAMDCQTCGMNIIFRTQDHASMKKKESSK